MNDAVYVNNAAAEVRHNRTLADFALLYADEGFRVLPLQSLRSPGCCSCGLANCSSVAKHPRTANGVKNATYEAEQVREWWQLYPDANIGIATGQGMLVIDIDPQQHALYSTFSHSLHEGVTLSHLAIDWPVERLYQV